MAQDIHLDAIVPGWTFLTALECDQEILILWNGYRCIRFLQPIIQHRTAACGLVRSKVASEAGVTWPRDEWQGTIEPRVWNWLCRKHTEARAALGSTPELTIKRVRIPKGWTIAIDNRTPHGGAPRNGPDALRVHMYAAARSVDVFTREVDGAIQDETINLGKSNYAPVVLWAHGQAVPAFGLEE